MTSGARPQLARGVQLYLSSNGELVIARGASAQIVDLEAPETLVEASHALQRGEQASARALAQLRELGVLRAPLGAWPSDIEVLATAEAGQEIAAQLGARTHARWGEAPLDTPLIAILEDVEGASLFDWLKRRSAPALPVLPFGEEVVVGPWYIPGATPCPGCRWLESFGMAEEGPDALDAVGAVRTTAVPALLSAMLTDHLKDLGACYEGVPDELLGVAGLWSPAGLRFEPVRADLRCGLCRPRESAHPIVALGTREMVDQTGGFRSETPDVSLQEGLRAIERLGHRLIWRDKPASKLELYPELAEVPFFHVVSEREGDAQVGVELPTDRFPDVSFFGKGLTQTQARCSAVFEWLERHLGRYLGQRELRTASYAQLRSEALNPELLLEGALEPTEWSESDPLDWVLGRSLIDGSPTYLPAACTFLQPPLPTHRPPRFPIKGSSGLSAGLAHSDAVLQGLYEVIEHDVWYASVRLQSAHPRIDPDQIEAPGALALMNDLQRAGLSISLRLLENDFGLPVVRCTLVSRRELTDWCFAGHGCSHDPQIALLRALTEAAQSLFSYASMAELSGEPYNLQTAPSSVFNNHIGHRTGVELVEGVADWPALRRAFSPLGSTHEYLNDAVKRVRAAIERAQLFFVDLTPSGLSPLVVTKTLVTGVHDNVGAPWFVQRRLKDRAGASPLYLGRIHS